MNSYYHDDNLLMTVVNLFAAGTDSTSSTIRFGLLLMAKYPKIQGKEHKYFMKHLLIKILFLQDLASHL